MQRVKILYGSVLFNEQVTDWQPLQIFLNIICNIFAFKVKYYVENMIELMHIHMSSTVGSVC